MATLRSDSDARQRYLEFWQVFNLVGRNSRGGTADGGFDSGQEAFFGSSSDAMKQRTW